MLDIDVIRTDRHVLSACIWISRVQELEPNALELDRGVGAAGAGDGEGEGEGAGDDPLFSPPVVPPPDGGA